MATSLVTQKKMLMYFIKSICHKLILYTQYVINIRSGFQRSAFKKKGGNCNFNLDFIIFFKRVHSTNSVEIIWELPVANFIRLSTKRAIEDIYNVFKTK